METFKKIKSSEKSKVFWIIGGLLKVLDGVTQIISLGYYCSNFNINYLINSKNRNQC